MTEAQDAASEPVSKSRRKRDAHAWQKLGEDLVGLTEAEFERLGLPEPLAQAVCEARGLSRGALKRQLKYLGRLLREADAGPVAEARDRVLGDKRRANAEFHRLERWRDRLIAEGDGALQEFLAEWPAADRRQLRQLTRNAQKEQARDAQSTRRATRTLFRYLRGLASE